MPTLLLLAATVRSFAHMPLGICDRNTANSSKMVITRHRIRYFFQKRAALPLTLLEN